MNDSDVRPRYGVVQRNNGDQQLVVFHPVPEMKETYRMLDAATEQPVVLDRGEKFHVGSSMRDDQAILYRVAGAKEDQVGVVSHRGRKEQPMTDNRDRKPLSPAKALAYLGVLGLMALGFIAGVVAIIRTL